MDISAEEIDSLPYVISEPRFATYLKATGGDKEAAITLYLWNLRASAAFMVPLHLCEVAVRNGVAEAIIKVHGSNWPWVNGFIRSLPSPKQKWLYNPQKDLIKASKKHPTAGKVIAELSLAFWEQMFTSRHDERLWKEHIHTSFPTVSTDISSHEVRATMAKDIYTVRKLRNRIAHHEPIFSRDLSTEYQRMRTLVQRRNHVAATWLDKIEAVTTLIDTRPPIASD